MTNDTWLEAFAHELEARGLPPIQRSELVVEAESYLADAGGAAFEHFGPPVTYAERLVAALGPRRADRQRTDPPLVEATDLSRSYRGRVVLDSVSVSAGVGEIVVLVGPNGSGKSTLLRILAGLESPDGGAVQRRCAVGYAPQHGGLDPYLNATEHVALFGAAVGLGRRSALTEGSVLAEQLGWGLRDQPRAALLSGGTRQKLTVLLAMLGRPPLLLLDEPYQGMDAEGTRRFWELLWSWGAEGGAAVVASHASDALERATSVVELSAVAGGHRR
ncbi:MAG: ABC transporter ATP-binding protein [Acidimicrobiales bacterium]|nr:ABC transporter ATP-binding protein [Acidimicrobiales bacterium]